MAYSTRYLYWIAGRVRGQITFGGVVERLDYLKQVFWQTICLESRVNRLKEETSAQVVECRRQIDVPAENRLSSFGCQLLYRFDHMDAVAAPSVLAESELKFQQTGVVPAADSAKYQAHSELDQ